MQNYNLIYYPDRRLKQKAEFVTVFNQDLKKEIDTIFKVMYQHKGIGLSAIHLGILKHVIVIDLSENNSSPQIFINTKLLDKKGETQATEGSVSAPGIKAKIKRYEETTIAYQDLNGEENTLTTDGLLSICIQHELEQLSGKFFLENLSKVKQKILLNKLQKQR